MAPSLKKSYQPALWIMGTLNWSMFDSPCLRMRVFNSTLVLELNGPRKIVSQSALRNFGG
jgi:hypothetical protein